MKNIRLPILILLSFLAPCLALVLCAGLVCIVFPPASGTFLGLSLMAGIVLAGLGLGLAALRAACRRVTGLRALTLRATAFAEEVEKGNFTVSLSPSSHEGFEKLFTAMRGIRRELQGKTEEAARRTREARELVEVNERIIA
ncbi:MAG: hypothetical protein LBN33_03470, partial [Desulfovibrio sp.]|nr:hypothetical protein [Desulfovibrio sp.]